MAWLWDAVPALTIAAPLLAACGLAVLRSHAAAANLGASALTFLLACLLPFAVDQPGGWLRPDGLAAFAALLTGFVGLTTAWYSRTWAAQAAQDGIAPARLRLYHAAFQALQAALLLALLSDNAGVTWMAMQVALVAIVFATGLSGPPQAMPAAVAASWRLLILGGVGLALALFGTVMLYVAALPVLGPGWAAMSWSGLASAAPRCQGATLSLAYAFLLIGYGTAAALVPLHAALAEAQAEGPAPIAAILSGGLPGAALILLLRTRDVLAGNAAAGGGAIAPGGPLIALGSLSVLLAGWVLWREAGWRRCLAYAGIGQSGVVAVAFGLGGTAATLAGLLHLAGQTLAKAAAVQCTDHAAAGMGHREPASRPGVRLPLLLSLLALAGLPPGGPFGTMLTIVAEAARRQPAMALVLGLGLLAAGWGLASRAQGLVRTGAPAARAAGRDGWVLAGAWANLLIVAIIGVALPAPLAAWLHGVAAALR